MPNGHFGPYKLIQQIAVGGMAEIHLAKTKGIAGFEKFVALKMIHPNFSEDQQFIEMLIDEAKLTVQLQHVNIAQTFDLGRVDDTFYITMEFVDGADLYKLLRKGAEMELDVPIEVAGFIAKEVANGLDYAHRKRDIHGRPLGIVHRDVSPQNVLISHAGEVKIVDFGIAKATLRARQTAVGVIKGKYYYMSPEQAWGEKLDPRSDIFSTGILLYEMLTGQMLYLEEDLHKLLSMVRKAEIDPPTTLRKGIPARLERIAMRALARKPENRYQSAADLGADLERFLHAHSPVFSPTNVTGWMSQILGERQPLDPSPVVEPPPPAASRITRDQLFLDGSEFTDHNSVIFTAEELDAERGAQIRSSPDGSVQVEPGPSDGVTHDLVDEFEDVATVAQAAAMRPPPIRRGTMPIDPGPDFDFEDVSDRTVVSGPPEMRSPRALFAPPPSRPPTEDFAHGGDEPTIPTDEERTIPEERSRPPLVASGFDEATEIESQPPTRSGKPQSAPPGWERSPALAAANPKPAVSALRPPRRSRKTPLSMPAENVLSDLLTGSGRVPKVAMGAPQGQTLPQGPQRPHGSPGSFGPPPHGPPQPPIGPGIDPAAAARPVQSRNPGSGPIPFPPPAAAARSPSASGLARPRFGGSGPFPGANPALMNTSMQMAAVEVDDIPDIYKLRRGGGSKLPWIIGGVVVAALIAVAIVAGVLGDGSAAGSGGPARIDVISTPPGGDVFIDGVALGQKTPAVFREAEQGRSYLVAIQLEKHQRWESETTVPGGQDRIKVIANLERLTVKLTVESNPIDAEVFLNGKAYGRTPLSLPDLDPEMATELVLKRRNYLPIKRRLDWSTEREKALSFELKK